MHELTLFYKPTCPYCQKVLRFLEKDNIPVPKKNISEDAKVRQELLAAGGRSQVPCLMIDGKPLYESDDIIRWLSENWGK